MATTSLYLSKRITSGVNLHQEVDVDPNFSLEELGLKIDQKAQVSFQNFSNVLEEFLAMASLILHTVWRTKKVSDVHSNENLTKNFRDQASLMQKNIYAIGTGMLLSGGCLAAGAIPSIPPEIKEQWLSKLPDMSKEGVTMYQTYTQSKTTILEGDARMKTSQMQEKANHGNTSKENINNVKQEKEKAEQKEAESARAL